MKRRLALALTLLALALPPATRAQDVGVQITPVIITLPSERPITSVRIANRRPHESAFEARAYVWSQDDGRDVLTETDDVLVAPSTFIIAAHRQQIVRLAVLDPPPALRRERTYRLVVRELPPADAQPGLRLQLRLSMPVFLSPPGPTARLQAQRTQAGALLVNAGDAHVRLHTVTTAPGGQPIEGAPRYLLAGASVALPAPSGAEALTVSYTAGRGETALFERLTLETAGSPPR